MTTETVPTDTADDSKRSAVVLLRWVLVIATSALILFGRSGGERLAGHVAVLLLILSNTLVAMIPSKYFQRPWMDSLLVLGDIILVTGALWISGCANGDFYLLYFVIIMIAALGETLRSILVSAMLVSSVYLGITVTLEGFRSVFDMSVLMRIPFFFIVALFYGYFAQLVRRERSARVVSETKLTLAKRLRELGQDISAGLDRQLILQRFVDAQVGFVGTPFAGVLSRVAKAIVAEAGEGPPSLRGEALAGFCSLLDRRIVSRERGREHLFDGALDPLISMKRLADGEGSVVFFREGEFTCVPLTGGLDSDLYLLLQGNIHGEILEYVGVMLLSANMALSNAAQFHALVHEVEKRQEVNRQLTEMVEFKSQFVANISHEIRTPIHSFIGFGELLLNGGYGDLGDEQRVTIARMVRNASNLLELVNNLLDFSKIEAGAMRVRKTLGQLDEFFRELYETCLPLVSDKPVALKVDLMDGIPPLHLDWQMLRQIALNLISNAIKFTARGRIDVTIRYTRESEVLRMVVRDTGIGIDPSRYAEIFEPFRQLENSYTKKYAGTGLGLAISKRQVELLGGSLTVRSKVGSWTEFALDLPASPFLPRDGVPGSVEAEPRVSANAAAADPMV